MIQLASHSAKRECTLVATVASMACTQELPYQQICVVNTFIHQPAESDDELTMVKSHTEPPSRSPAIALDQDSEASVCTSDDLFRKNLKVAELVQHASNTASDAKTDHLTSKFPGQKLGVLNTFIHQTDESEKQDLSLHLIVRSRTEPAKRMACDAQYAQRKQEEKSVRFTDVAGSIEDDNSDELAMTYTRTFDPFEYSEMGECGSEAHYAQRNQEGKSVHFTDVADSIGDDNSDGLAMTYTRTFDPFEYSEMGGCVSDRTVDDMDSDELPVTSMKTFSYFENTASILPVLQPVLAALQPVSVLGLGMAGVVLMPAQSCHAFHPSGHVQANAPDRPCQKSAQPACHESDISTGQYQEHVPSVSEPAAADISNNSAMPEQRCMQEELPRLLGTSPRSDALSKHVSISSPLQVDFSSCGRALVRWALDVGKLSSSEKQLLSPEFRIDFPGLGPQPFRMMVLAKQMTRHKGGLTFAKAQGRARLLIKTAGSMPDHASRVAFRMTIGETSRGPFWHQFAEQTCCDLQAAHEDWDLLASKSYKHVEVCLEVAEFEGRPN